MSIIPDKETLTVEFKSDSERLSDDEILEQVVAMANTQGGDIYIGVEDNGTPTGLHSAHSDPVRLAAMLGNKTVPSVSARTTLYTVDGVQIITISVPPHSGTLVSTVSGRIMRRRLKHDGTPETVPLYPYEIPRMLSNIGNLDISEQPAPSATLVDLDPLERERLRQIINSYNGDKALLALSDEELDGALGLTTTIGNERVPTVTGLLMIGREESIRRSLPTHELMFQVLSGTAVRVNDSFRDPLLKLMETLLERFRARNEQEEIDIGMFRVPVPDYDERAFREALINSLSHRDYTLLGAVHVQMTDTELIIMNPGGFVEGVTIDNLLSAPPRSRNPRLADALKRVGLAERTGRGVDRIFEGMLRYGRPEPDYTGSTSTTINLRLSRAKADTSFFKMIRNAEQQQGSPLPLDDLLILSHLRDERRLRTQDIAQTLRRSESVTRSLLEKLLEIGLVEAHGTGRGRSYTLSARVYKAEGRTTEYVRQAGFDPIQQRQMVLNLAKVKGRIKRVDVAELCHIGPDQAYRLLTKLIESGELRIVGVSKGAHYELNA